MHNSIPQLQFSPCPRSKTIPEGSGRSVSQRLRVQASRFVCIIRDRIPVGDILMDSILADDTLRKPRSPLYLKSFHESRAIMFIHWHLRARNHEECFNECDCLVNVQARCHSAAVENEIFVTEYINSLHDAHSLLILLQTRFDFSHEFQDRLAGVKTVEATMQDISRMVPHVLENRADSIELYASSLSERIPAVYTANVKAYIRHVTSHSPHEFRHFVVKNLERILYEEALVYAVDLLRDIDPNLVLDTPTVADIYQLTPAAQAR